MASNKKSFAVGVALTIIFFSLLIIILSPIFNGQNGMVYADNLFNSIAKGSSYFIPKVIKDTSKFEGKMIDVTIKASSSEEAEKMSKLLTAAGASVSISGAELRVNGDLGVIARSAAIDADAAFNNEGDKLVQKYGYPGREVMYYWWNSLTSLDKALKKQELFAESSFVDKTVKRAIEPAYNFWGIEKKNIRDYAGTVAILLIFYLLYTVLWGFAIYYLFEGMGITMAKPTKKEEV